MSKYFNVEQMTGLKDQEINFIIEYVKDFSPRRAAEASGYEPDYGYTLRNKEHVQHAINAVLLTRRKMAEIDAEWLLGELVDNHHIARQQGNLAASNKALDSIMKHVYVDAQAVKKVEVDVSTDEKILERLRRGRERLSKRNSDDEVSFL